jgi:hypothetical protein
LAQQQLKCFFVRIDAGVVNSWFGGRTLSLRSAVPAAPHLEIARQIGQMIGHASDKGARKL